MVLIALIASSIGTVSALSYNRDTAANYALNNAYNEVPGSWYFYSHGGDCTNFASWVMNAGGWPMKYDVYPYGWYFIVAPKLYSSSWTSVREFGEFVKYRGYQISLGNSPDSIKANLAYWIKKGTIQRGDILQRVPGTSPGHTMIITGVNQVTGKVTITYHSTGPDNKRDWSFDEFMSQYGQGSFVAYHLLDNYSY